MHEFNKARVLVAHVDSGNFNPRLLETITAVIPTATVIVADTKEDSPTLNDILSESRGSLYGLRSDYSRDPEPTSKDEPPVRPWKQSEGRRFDGQPKNMFHKTKKFKPHKGRK